ncbi:MAG: Tyrosine recombinase XerC [Eubacterium sp.]|uniref:tyrosine-type recombinase/integrase n=1 Tax=Eubacterium sp. TaxID=142586 RepID=UPI003039F188
MKTEMTLAEWIGKRQQAVRLTSLKTYESYERAHIIPFLGSQSLVSINNQRMLEFREHLKRKEKLAPKTIRDIQGHLIKILKDAKERGYIEALPEAPKTALKIREKPVLSQSEQKILCETLKKDLNAKSMAVLLSAGAGLRLGEVMGLNVGDVDLDAGVLRVRYSRQRVKTEKEDKTCVIKTALKTGKSRRDIPLNTPLKQILKEYLKHSAKKDFHKPLISWKEKKPIDARTVQYYFTELKKSHQLDPSVTFHSLRHSFATRALEAGVDMQALSELMGHSSVAFTLSCYGHCATEHKRAQMEKMAKCW